MEEIVIDSHALFWFLTGNQKLSSKAQRVIEDAAQVIVPTIVLLEIYYLLKKQGLGHRFIELLAEIKNRTYLVYPLDLEVVVHVVSLDDALEMHDRVIVATAAMWRVPIVTKDSIIQRTYPKTVW